MDGLRLENGYVAAGAFDFDGNVLNTPSTHFYVKISTGRVEEIPAHEVDQNPERFFGENREYDFVDGNPEKSFRNFRCVSPYSDRGFDGLLKDVERALSDDAFSPSFESFKNIFLVKGRIWSLITARGNAPDNFERVFKFINDVTLSQEEKEEQLENIRKNFFLPQKMSNTEVLQYYFRDFVVDFICCNNAHLQRQMGLLSPHGGERKACAMNWWISEVQRKVGTLSREGGVDLGKSNNLAVGFSDDSVGNIIAMNGYFSQKVLVSQGKIRARSFYTGPECNLDQLEGSHYGSKIIDGKDGITREFRFG